MSESFKKICTQCSSEVSATFKFCGNCGQQLLESPQDDRREVVVLFADVTGFTSMCERLDPEEIHWFMNECFAGLGQAIQAEEGFVDRYLGDAVLAIFGAPTAHEDDPARACRAALSMQTFLTEISEKSKRQLGTTLQMRIGIHCGLVVAGAVGSEARMVYGATGDTMNTAARIQSSASPGSVLVSDKVVKRTRGLFELGPTQFLKVKGKEETVKVYELLRAVEDDKLKNKDPLFVPIVGRERELRQLRKMLEGSVGAKRWIEVRGEIGIGKTRLIDELATHITGRRLLKLMAPSGGRQRPFELVRQLIYVVIQEGTDMVERPETHDSFAIAVEQLGSSLVPYAGALWHLAAPSRLSVPPPDPNPLTLRKTLERGIGTLLTCLAARVPILALFIDSYDLVDDASADLLESLVVQRNGWSFPVVVASRGESGRAQLYPQNVIKLDRLSHQESEKLLERLVRGATLPDMLKQNILERAAGVPLHNVELARVLIDEEVLTPSTEEASRWVCDVQKGSVSLPASVRAAMMCRLDRLDRSERGFLCQCSVQGTEFDLELAEEVYRVKDVQRQSVASLLQQLADRGLVRHLREQWWRFCGPLMQETCYDTLLLRERLALHGEMADALCKIAGGAEFVSPELLARHFEGAKQWANAAKANLRAGDRASELFLNDEAIRRYDRAIEMNRKEDEQQESASHVNMLAYRGETRVFLRIGKYQLAETHAKHMRAFAVRRTDQAEADRLTAASFFHRGHMEHAERLLLSALTLSQEDQIAEDVQLSLRCDLAELYHRADRTAEAFATLKQCRIAALGRYPLLSFQADMLEGKLAHTEGRFTEAAAFYMRAHDTAESVGGLSELARASNCRGNVARDLGEYDTAQRFFQLSLEIWERTGDTECIAGAHNNLGNLMMSLGNFVAARHHHMQSIAKCREIGNIHGLSLAQANLAILSMEEGDSSMAVASAEAALETLSGSGNALLHGLVLVILGEGRLECGNAAAAQSILQSVLEKYDEGSHPLAVAGAYRGLGRVELLRGTPAEAVQYFDRALVIFEKLKRTQEAARTVLHKAEALWHLGKVARAHKELEKALEKFLVIRAKGDIKRAKQLLVILSDSDQPTKS